MSDVIVWAIHSSSVASGGCWGVRPYRGESMGDVTPIRKKRVDGRSRKQKLSAVLAADMVGVVAAAKQTGIPESTIRYWAEKPEFAEYRAKTREDLADEVRITAHLAW